MVKQKAGRVFDFIIKYELLLLAAGIPVLVLPRSYIWKWQRGLNTYAPVDDSTLFYPDPLPYLALGIIALPWLLRLARRGYLTTRTPLDVPIVLYLLTAAIGLIPSVDFAFSLERFWGMVAGVALYYGLVNGIKSQRRLQAAVSLLLLGATILSSLAFAQTDWNKPISRYELDILQPVYELLGRIPKIWAKGFNISVLAGTLIIIIPIALCLLFSGVKWRHRLALGLSLLVMAGYVLLGGSRGDIVALALTLLILPALRRRRWFLLLFVGSLTLVLVAAFSALRVPWDPVSSLAQFYPSRWAVWTRAAYMIKDYPFTGVGLDTFRIIAQNNYPYFNNAYNQTEHAHNLFLQAGVDQGVLGVIAVLWLIVAFFWVGMRAMRYGLGNSEQQPGPNRYLRFLTLGLMGGFIAFIIGGVFDNGVASGARMALVMWIVLGLMIAVAKVQKLELSNQEAIAQKHKPRVLNIKLSKGPKWLVVVSVMMLTVLIMAPTMASAFSNNLGNLYRNKGWLAKDIPAANRDSYAENAVRCYLRSIELNPGNALAYRNLGGLYLHSQYPEATICRLEGTDGYNFDDSFLAFFDKISKLAGGKTCFAHLERSVELDPTDIFARLFLGEAYREEGKLDAAIEQYEPIAAKSPEPRLHEKLANMYRQDSRYDQAIAEFQRTIELDPKSTSCHRELANLYRDMGQLEKAVVEYTQVLCLDPNDSYAKQELEKLQGR